MLSALLFLRSTPPLVNGSPVSPAAGAAAERVPGEGIHARRLDEQHQADHQLVAARRLEATLHHARPQVGHRRAHGRLQGQGQRVCVYVRAVRCALKCTSTGFSPNAVLAHF